MTKIVSKGHKLFQITPKIHKRSQMGQNDPSLQEWLNEHHNTLRVHVFIQSFPLNTVSERKRTEKDKAIKEIGYWKKLASTQKEYIYYSSVLIGCQGICKNFLQIMFPLFCFQQTRSRYEMSPGPLGQRGMSQRKWQTVMASKTVQSWTGIVLLFCDVSLCDVLHPSAPLTAFLIHKK